MKDLLAKATTKPPLGELEAELRRASIDNGSAHRLQRHENTRFCLWSGQSEDGKKWTKNLSKTGEKVFPWEGASDSRVFLADELINSLVDLTGTAFWRASLRVSPVAYTGADTSSTTNTLMHWLVYNRLFNELTQEVELLGQFTWTYGWAAAHISWQQQLGFKSQKLTAQGVMALAQSSPQGSALADLPTLIPNPEAEDQVAEILMGAFPHLKKSDARKAVRDMRETSECEFPIPTVVKNQPQITALTPYDEFCFPPETTDVQTARVLFRRCRYSEAELRGMASEYEWDEKWLEEAVATAGKYSVTTTINTAEGPLTHNYLANENKIEIVWAYTRSVDDNNVPGIYCTVFSPYILDSWGSHELLDYGHGEYPFVVFRAETIHRKIVESRGVPEVTGTWQNEVKVQRDSIFDFTSICTLPPLQVPKGRAGQITLAPAGQIPVLRPGEISFMEPPAREPSIAFNIIQSIETQGDRYYGRPTEKVFPVLTQMRQQRIVTNWLHNWTIVFRQVLALALQYLPPEEIQKITGSQAPLDESNPEMDVTLQFDVRELSTDLATEKLKAIAELVLPLDSAGVVDRAKLVELALHAIDSGMAQQLVMQRGPAAQQMFDETNNEIALMALGNPPKLRENDPTAQTRMAFAQQIVQSNPKYQQGLQNDPIFKENFQQYAKNLQFSVQQQQNAMTGRLGVPQGASQPPQGMPQS